MVLTLIQRKLIYIYSPNFLIIWRTQVLRSFNRVNLSVKILKKFYYRHSNISVGLGLNAALITKFEKKCCICFQGAKL